MPFFENKLTEIVFFWVQKEYFYNLFLTWYAYCHVNKYQFKVIIK